MRSWQFTPVFLLLASCASTPAPQLPVSHTPSWIHDATRRVDSGYIVYVGRGEAAQFERALFNAEAVAIGDLSNECSFAPKGARVEDRYDDFNGNTHHVYAKIGVSYEDCEAAKKATTPEAIRALANVPMAEVWKRYQDIYFAETNAQDQVAQLRNNDNYDDNENFIPSLTSGGSGEVGDISSLPGEWDTKETPRDFITLRQQVAYAKQMVILAPKTTYSSNTSLGKWFTSRVAPATNVIHQFETHHPSVHSTPITFSKVRELPGYIPPPRSPSVSQNGALFIQPPPAPRDDSQRHTGFQTPEIQRYQPTYLSEHGVTTFSSLGYRPSHPVSGGGGYTPSYAPSVGGGAYRAQEPVHFQPRENRQLSQFASPQNFQTQPSHFERPTAIPTAPPPSMHPVSRPEPHFSGGSHHHH